VEGFTQIINEAKKAGFIPSLGEHDDLTPTELYNKLAAMPFWCADDFIHETDPNYKDRGCCLTHTVGLPKHPATQLEMPLTPYQVDFVKQVIKAVTNPGHMTKEAWDRLHHAFHLNKGRQMGFTEIVLRLIQYFCFNRYAGKTVPSEFIQAVIRFSIVIVFLVYAIITPLRQAVIPIFISDCTKYAMFTNSKFPQVLLIRIFLGSF